MSTSMSDVFVELDMVMASVRSPELRAKENPESSAH